jgi:peptide/nickel transport system substrate-binding protein
MTDELFELGSRVLRGRLSRRAFIGRAAALGISAVSAQSILAGAAQAAAPERGGTMRVGMQGGASTDSLDPALAANQVTATLNTLWGEGLVALAPDGTLEPVLAESWMASDGGKTWTFEIRKGVVFSDGRSLMPADVVATIERHRDKLSQSGALGILTDLTGVSADGNTVVFRLGQANADMPFLMQDYHLMIQPNGGRDAATAAIGSGPYKLVETEPGVRHLFTRNESHWNAAKQGFADQVEILVINDPTARVAAFQSGKVDMIDRIEPKTVALLKRLPGVSIKNVSGRGHYPFNMFCDTAPFDNPDLRLALKLAMDREEMVKRILAGYGSVGNDTPINAAYPLFEPIEQRAFDPERAASHYKKSGHSGPILLRTSEVAFPGAVDAAVLYQQSCQKAGIEIEVKREPGDGYWSNVWNIQPFSTSYWGGRATQDQMYSTAYLSTADWNDTRFKHPDFDTMLINARGELDETKRRAIYRDMNEMVRDDGGTIVPMFNDFVDAVSEKVQGWVDNPAGELMNGFAPARCWLSA